MNTDFRVRRPSKGVTSTEAMLIGYILGFVSSIVLIAVLPV